VDRTSPREIPPLPNTVRVVVRDWLNANSIVLLQPGCNVVVDTGYVVTRTRRRRSYVAPSILAASRCSSWRTPTVTADHMGGNALLMRTYGCPVAVPEGEAAFIRNWVKRALWLDFADQRAERFAARTELAASRRYCWGGRPSLHPGMTLARWTLTARQWDC